MSFQWGRITSSYSCGCFVLHFWLWLFLEFLFQCEHIPSRCREGKHDFILLHGFKGVLLFSAKTFCKCMTVICVLCFSENTSPVGAQEGKHDFIMHSFDVPTICDVCRKLLRGVFYQGYKCQCKCKIAFTFILSCIPTLENALTKMCFLCYTVRISTLQRKTRKIVIPDREL